MFKVFVYMPLPEDFKDRPKLSRLFADLLILTHRKKIKMVCCESYKKSTKCAPAKGAQIYTEKMLHQLGVDFWQSGE